MFHSYADASIQQKPLNNHTGTRVESLSCVGTKEIPTRKHWDMHHLFSSLKYFLMLMFRLQSQQNKTKHDDADVPQLFQCPVMGGTIFLVLDLHSHNGAREVPYLTVLTGLQGQQVWR